jgi:hypothetical protein
MHPVIWVIWYIKLNEKHIVFVAKKIFRQKGQIVLEFLPLAPINGGNKNGANGDANVNYRILANKGHFLGKCLWRSPLVTINAM